MHRLGKKHLICISSKVLIKVQQSLIKVPNRTYWNISRSIIANLTLGRRYENGCSSQNSLLKIENVFSPCPGAIITFSSLVIFGISETRVVSFDPVMCIFRGSSTETNTFHFCHFYFQSFCFHRKHFFQ